METAVSYRYGQPRSGLGAAVVARDSADSGILPAPIREERRFGVVSGHREAARPSEVESSLRPFDALSRTSPEPSGPVFASSASTNWVPRPAGHAVGAVEQYGRLAATLMRAQQTHGIRVLMVASAVAGEGKTLTAANLAMTLSRTYGLRVLLIDADLRRPAQHHVFGVRSDRGLRAYLDGDSRSVVETVQINPLLSLVPAGRPGSDPLRGVASQRMIELLREAAVQFDWVILDTPPATEAPDARVLADLVDAAILVVAAGATSHESIEQAVAEIGRERIVGTVLNRVTHAVPGAYSTAKRS